MQIDNLIREMTDEEYAQYKEDIENSTALTTE